MGTPVRHGGFPFVDGEILTGADLENDISQLFTEILNIQNVNVAVGAAIAGSKLAANSVAAAQITPLTITAAEIANGTITTTQIAASTILQANLAGNSIGLAQMQNNSVGQVEIVNLACSLRNFTRSSGDDAIAGSGNSNTVSRTFTTAASAGDVLVLFNAFARSDGADDVDIDIRMLRDAVTFNTQVCAGITGAQNEFCISAIGVDTGASDATSHSYIVNILNNHATAVTIRDRQIVTIEFRR